MEESIKSRFMKLESDLTQLKKLVLGGKADAGKAGKPEPEIADDDLLDREWADMVIRKDPPKAKESFAGRKMSECTASFLRGYASFHEWKAQKGRESLDQKALKADHPDLYEAYTRTGASFRVARIVGGK